MSRKPETIFRERIKPFLDAIPKSKFFTVQQIAIVGTPDLLGGVNGWFVALELKKGLKAKRSALQKYNLERINRAGGFGLFVSPENWQATLEFLKFLSKEGHQHDRDYLWGIKRRIFCESLGEAESVD